MRRSVAVLRVAGMRPLPSAAAWTVGTVHAHGDPSWCPGPGTIMRTDGQRPDRCALRWRDHGSRQRGVVAMSVFSEAELRYLTGGRQLGRIATVGADGTP